MSDETQRYVEAATRHSGSAREVHPLAGQVMCFATQGHEHLDGHRIRGLLEDLQPEAYPFDHSHKLRSAVGLLRAALRKRPKLIVMEGTGIGGGLVLLVLHAIRGMPYVVSSGDAVGPYMRKRSLLLGLLGHIYERALCRCCAGFVGWTPYLVGRALSFGVPRAMTAPGWNRNEPSPGAREQVRRALGIPPDALVVGFTGSMVWSRRHDYVYGAELITALRRCSRRDLVVCYVGAGPGLERLERMAGAELGGGVVLTGRVQPEEVADHLAAFDVASVSQSTDPVGAFRYTTKLSEYLAAGLPVITCETPTAYDLDEGFFGRLPGTAPWSEEYVDALMRLFATLTHADVAQRRAAVRSRRADPFDKAGQQRRMTAFVEDLLAARAPLAHGKPWQ